MSPMPRRTPPSKEERDRNVRKQMLPGALAGATRQVAPQRNRGGGATSPPIRGVQVYIQPDEPTDAQTGDFWLDTDAACGDPA